MLESFLMEGLIHSFCVGEHLWVYLITCPPVKWPLEAALKRCAGQRRAVNQMCQLSLSWYNTAFLWFFRYLTAQLLQSQNGAFLCKVACIYQLTDIMRMWFYRQISFLSGVQYAKSTQFWEHTQYSILKEPETQ